MYTSPIRICGTGCALADFLYTGVQFRSSEFKKYLSVQPGDGGLSPGKLVFTEELEIFAKKPFQTILAELTNDFPPDSINIGGPGIVSLIHTSQILPEEKFEVCFYGKAGNDEIANYIFAKLNNTPLNISNYKKAGNKSTAFTDVFSDPTFDEGHGERTFVNNIGAAWDFTPEDLPSDFFNAQIVCFGGTALVPQIHDNLTRLLRKAKDRNSITVVNTVFDFRNEKNNPGTAWSLGDKEESIHLMDILIMDKEEALKISGKSSIEEAGNYFIQLGVSSFFITNGSKEIVIYSDGNLFVKSGMCSFPVSARIVNELKTKPEFRGDTTGCGDNFAGGIISSIALQMTAKQRGNFDILDALAWGVSSGGFTCFYLGGTYFEENRGQKLSLLLDYKNDYLKQINAL